jgi:hypothetical protein
MAPQSLAFPEEQLVNDLRTWWDEEVAGADDPFAEHPPTTGTDPSSGTIYDVQPAVDSLGVVRRLALIDKQVGFRVPSDIVRRGGYHSFDDMIADLIPKVRDLYTKNQKKTAV